MNLQEAYQILGVSAKSSLEEINKKFKKLAAKYHPDVNKDPGAEEQAKKINAAYSVIKDSQNSPPISFPTNPFKNGFWKKTRFVSTLKPILQIPLTISFAESVLGCTKTISYSRDVGCESCEGEGIIQTSTSCSECQGKGFTIKTEYMFINGGKQQIKIKHECFTCEGHGTVSQSCEKCQGTGSVSQQHSLEVKVPGGVTSENKLKLDGQGHHVGSHMYQPALVDIIVTPEVNMTLRDQHVVSDLELTLLQALQGCEMEVSTVQGMKKVSIPPLTKHSDEVFVPQAGVNQQGNHIFKLKVIYPTNVEKLITVLQEN